MKTPERDVEAPQSDDFYCPICGFENPETIYEVPGNGAVGCNECLSAYDPWDYYERR